MTDARAVASRSETMEDAVSALLGLGGSASLRVSRTAENTVRIDVLTVETSSFRPLMPLVYDLQMELDVQLHPESQSYTVSGRYYEATGFSTSTETFRGMYRRRESGRVLSLDGGKTVAFNTGEVYDLIEEALAPLDWSRGRGRRRREKAQGKQRGAPVWGRAALFTFIGTLLLVYVLVATNALPGGTWVAAMAAVLIASTVLAVVSLARGERRAPAIWTLSLAVAAPLAIVVGFAVFFRFFYAG